jgi:hypothetical protein
MSTYDGYFNGAGLARMLQNFTKELDESVMRMRSEEAISVGALDGQFEEKGK